MARSKANDDCEAALERQREQFHRELMRKSLRIAELELEIKHTRAEYESSLSWRLTRPLRIRRYIQSKRAAGPLAG
jgi:hypothetical protein